MSSPAPIRIPYRFEPRPYQIPFWEAMDNGCRYGVAVWHRRSGKDKTFWNFMIREAFRRIGNYYYFLPTYNQGRKIIWDGKDKGGMPFLSHIPKQLMKGDPNNTDMRINLVNLYDANEAGSQIQVIGSDNIDSIVGTNPVGCVFSEYSLQDPRGWDFIRPILRENGGWAIFNYTPRGKNHGFELYEMARRNPEWYVSRLTVEDTYGRGGTVGPEDVDLERRAGMRENLIQQEYYVSFEAAVENAVWADEVYACRNGGRVTRVPWDARTPVDTYWDIGWDDATAIWFVQQFRNEIRLVDYYEGRLAGIEHYVKVLRDKPYIYGRHLHPHDSGSKLMASGGKSMQEMAWECGLSVEVAPRLTKEEQIQHARSVFNRCWFDEDRCAKGFDALSSYHFGFDEAKRVLSRSPVHDWSSHASDAFMLMACNVEAVARGERKRLEYPALGIV